MMQNEHSRIDEFKAREKQMCSTILRYQTIMDSAKEGIWITDPHGVTKYVNARMAEMLGYTVDEFAGRSIFSFMPVSEVSKAEELVARRISGIAEIHEFRFKKKKGDDLWVIVSSNPVFNENGSVAELVGMITDVTNLKNVQQELEKKSVLLENAEKIARLGSWEWDILKDQWYFSNEWIQISGFSKSPENLDALRAIVLKEELPEIEQALNDALQGLRPYNIQHQIVHQKTGEIKWVHAQGSVEFDQAHRPIRFTGVVRDITEDRHIQEKTNLLAAIVENSPGFIGISTVDRRAMYLNEAGRKLVGLDCAEDIKATVIEDYLFPDDLPFVRDHIFPALQSGGRWSGEFRFRHFKSHAEIPVFYDIFAVSNPVSGKITSYATVSHDISKLKQYRQERERLMVEIQFRLTELETVVESVPDGLIIYGASMETILENDTAKKILGRDGTMTNLTIDQMLAQEQISQLDGSPMSIEEFGPVRACAGEIVSNQLATIIRPKDNTMRWIVISAAPLRLPDNTLRGVIAIISDITAMRELQIQQEDFMYIVAHDLRTPLQTICGFTQILKEIVDLEHIDSDARQACDSIMKSSEQMKVMIQDLVDAARVTSGQFQLRVEMIDIGTFTNELLSRLGKAVPVERIKVHIATRLPPVEVDPVGLERMLLNLLTNALKYSPPDRPVIIQAAAIDTMVELSVIDQGPGISPQEQKKLFSRFYRSKNKLKGEGLGLGLYITRLLAQAHHGTIRVKSEEGKGSCFTIALPADSEGDQHWRASDDK